MALGHQEVEKVVSSLSAHSPGQTWGSPGVVGDQPEPGMECPSENGCSQVQGPPWQAPREVPSFGPRCEMSPKAPCTFPPAAGLGMSSWDGAGGQPSSSPSPIPEAAGLEDKRKKGFGLGSFLGNPPHPCLARMPKAACHASVPCPGRMAGHPPPALLRFVYPP